MAFKKKVFKEIYELYLIVCIVLYINIFDYYK